MKIFGREIAFKRTVQATIKIADMCENGDAKNIETLFEGTYQTSQKQAAKFIVALNEGFETFKAFEDKAYTPNPLTLDEALALPDEDFDELFSEAIKAYTGETTTVKTVPAKGKKKESQSA